jgi:hypothetical protein
MTPSQTEALNGLLREVAQLTETVDTNVLNAILMPAIIMKFPPIDERRLLQEVKRRTRFSIGTLNEQMSELRRNLQEQERRDRGAAPRPEWLAELNPATKEGPERN